MMMTVSRHKTATMPAFLVLYSDGSRLTRQKQSHVLGRDDDVGKHFLLQCMRQLGASHSSSQPLDLHRDLKLSPRATSHSLSLVPPHSVAAACSHTPFARLTRSLPFAPVTFSLLRILLVPVGISHSQQGGEGKVAEKSAPFAYLCCAWQYSALSS